MTLSQTLLPYINKCDDYSFIRDKDSFTVTRFLESLVNYLKDTEGGVSKGFMLFGIKVSPRMIEGIVTFKTNRKSL
jgi:hypothetical protein